MIIVMGASVADGNTGPQREGSVAVKVSTTFKDYLEKQEAG